jgi:DNA-binding IclR family transcriptional regulator
MDYQRHTRDSAESIRHNAKDGACSKGRNVAHSDDPGHTAIAHGSRRPVIRAMEILEVLVDAECALGVTEVGQRAGIPKSTAARLLNELVDIGMAARSGRLYGPGPRLRNLVKRADRRGTARMRRLVVPDLVRLHDETGLDVAFATLRQGRVQFETVFYGPDRADVLSAVPLSTPAHCTGTGKVLLAYTPRATISQPLDAYTERTITDPVALARELEQIRRDGIAHNDREYIDGIGSIAVPVLGARKRAVGALAVCGSADVIDAGRVRDASRRAGRAASAAIRDGLDSAGKSRKRHHL